MPGDSVTPPAEAAKVQAFLKRVELDKYLPAFQSMGVESFNDFGEIKDRDLDAIGMSTLKKRRFRRGLQEEANNVGLDPTELFPGQGEQTTEGQIGDGSGNIWFYFLGTMFTQIGQSSMLVLTPLITIHITGSTAVGAAAGTAAAGCAAAGQLIFIPLLKKFDMRVILLMTMIWKICMLIALTYLYAHSDDYTGLHKHIVSAIVFTLCLADSVPRGGIDSLRNVIPMVYLGADKEALSQFYAKFQLAYNIAMCAGPGMLGYCLQHYGQSAATYMVLVSYILAVITFFWMPSVSYSKDAADAANKAKKDKKGPKQGFWSMCSGSLGKLKHPLILVPFVGGLNVQGQRLKGIYSTVFAKGLLHEETGHTAGYIVSMQGLGGIVGAAMAARFGTSCKAQYWFLFGITIVIMRTWAWVSSVAIMDAGGSTDEAALSFIAVTFMYGLSNMITINVMVTLLNSRAQSVEIMGLSRFLIRMSGVATKAGVTFLVARYELLGLGTEEGTDYPALFFTMSCFISFFFCLPAFLCFLHLACYSGEGFEYTYPDYEEVCCPDDKDKEGTELTSLKTSTSPAVDYGAVKTEVGAGQA